ncbi:WD40 repeat domain-containing serine/threonine protein kinase [Roseimicrobium gellanilyticum]|uniref:WD40 repeat domain-containing serine/threonine protein kinase n=1 Tax=Roseimicrobium gellanilyticum TaxID=748857 RepID=UPI001472B226|nr:WD40 repeat domain-containing serine/threonine protein kinase [Roseimicrobium gellanilyticum]
MVARHRLINLIGAGGMGEVWRAEKLPEGTALPQGVAGEARAESTMLRAVKFMKVVTPDLISRFQHECLQHARLNHPNIATLHDHGVFERYKGGDGHPFISMELVECRRVVDTSASGTAHAPTHRRSVTITEYADLFGLTVQERIRLFIKVCASVSYLHAVARITHRDLKPENILVSDVHQDPEPKLIDFGIARMTEGPGLTRDQFVSPGTYTHMAPEQHLSKLTTPATDVYALGCILCSLLIGRLPHEENELLAIRKHNKSVGKVLEENDPPRPGALFERLTESQQKVVAERRGTTPQELARLLRSDLDWIVRRCLLGDVPEEGKADTAGSKSERYARPDQLARSLTDFLEGRPVPDHPGLFYPLRKLAQRHRVVAIAAGIALMALVVGLGASLYFLSSSRESERKALSSKDNADKATAAMRTAVDNLEIEAKEKENALMEARAAERRAKKAAETARIYAVEASTQERAAEKARLEADANAGRAKEQSTKLLHQQVRLHIANAARQFLDGQERHAVLSLVEALRLDPAQSEARAALLNHLVYQTPPAPLSTRVAVPAGESDIIFTDNGRKALVFHGSRGLLISLPDGSTREELRTEYGFGHPFFLGDNNTLISVGSGGDGADGFTLVSYWDTSKSPARRRDFRVGPQVVLKPQEKQGSMLVLVYDEGNYVESRRYPLLDLSENLAKTVSQEDSGIADRNMADVSVYPLHTHSPDQTWQLQRQGGWHSEEPATFGSKLGRIFGKGHETPATSGEPVHWALFRLGEKKPRVSFEPSTHLCFASDNQHLLAVQGEQVDLLHLESGKAVATTAVPSAAVFRDGLADIRYHAPTQRFAALDTAGGLWIWKRLKGRPLIETETVDLDLTGSTEWAFGPEESILTWNRQGRLFLWDFGDRPQELINAGWKKRPPSDEDSSGSTSGNGPGTGATGVEWHPTPRKLDPGGRIASVKACPDNRHFVVLCQEGYAAVWTKESASALPGRTPLVKTPSLNPGASIVFSGDGGRIFASENLQQDSRSEKAAMWAVWNANPLSRASIILPPQARGGLQSDLTGSRLLAGKTTYILNEERTQYAVAPPAIPKSYDLRWGENDFIRMNSDGWILAHLQNTDPDSDPIRVGLWRFGKNEPVLAKQWENTRHPLKESVSYLQDMALSPDGSTLLRLREDGLAELFDCATGKILWSQIFKGAALSHVAFVPQESLVIIHSDEGAQRLLLLDVKTGQVRGMVESVEDLGKIQVSDDQRTLVSSNDTRIRSWAIPSLVESAYYRRNSEPWEDPDKVSSYASQDAGLHQAQVSADGTLVLAVSSVEHSGAHLELAHLASGLPLALVWLREHGIAALPPQVTREGITVGGVDGSIHTWPLAPPGSEAVPDAFITTVHAVLGLKMKGNIAVEFHDQGETLAQARAALTATHDDSNVYLRVAQWLLSAPAERKSNPFLGAP